MNDMPSSAGKESISPKDDMPSSAGKESISPKDMEQTEEEKLERAIHLNSLKTEANNTQHSEENTRIVNEAYGSVLKWLIKEYNGRIGIICVAIACVCYIFGYADYSDDWSWLLSGLQNLFQCFLSIFIFLLIGYPTLSVTKRFLMQWLTAITEKPEIPQEHKEREKS